MLERKDDKTRNLSIYDFLNVLQQEFFIAYLRNKIYVNESDKKYWAKIMGFKKGKITNLSLRNDLPSIFTDHKMYYDLYRQTVLTKGIPNFMYISEANRIDLEKRDILSYYRTGCECKVYLGDGEFKIGEIKKCDVENKEIHVKFKNSDDINLYKFNQVNRIF